MRLARTSNLGVRSRRFAARNLKEDKNVGHSLYFLTATWLAAQGIEPQAVMPGTINQHCSSCQQGGMNQHMQPMGGRRPGLFQRMGQRIRGIVDWCLGDDGDDNDSSGMQNSQGMQGMQGTHGMQGMRHVQPGQQTTYPVTDMNLSFPTNAKVTEPPLADVVQGQQNQKPQPKNLAPINFRSQGGNSKGSVSAAMADKVGHEADFSWITGQLRRDNGRWTIHFATPETVDRYNGRLPIAPGPDMSRFEEGDLVTAHGQISPRGSLPMYQASSVDLIEHETK